MSRVGEAVDALGDVELFHGFMESDLLRVVTLAAQLDVPAGKAITEQGARDPRFVVLLEGHARVEIDGEVIEEIGPGDYFGEIALLDGGPRSASVVATTPVRILALERMSFRPVLQDHPEIAEQLLLGMCARLRRAQAVKLP